MRYAALLGSINVGGNRLKMAELKAALERCGFAQVETVMASGNVLFDDDRTPQDDLARDIAARIDDAFGISTFAAVRSKAELQSAIDDNPFKGKGEDKFVHTLFLDSALEDGAFARLDAAHEGPEKLAPGSREVYIDYVDGVGDSKLTKAFLEKHLGRSGTARNMSSLAKIIAKF